MFLSQAAGSKLLAEKYQVRSGANCGGQQVSSATFFHVIMDLTLMSFGPAGAGGGDLDCGSWRLPSQC